VCDFQNQLSKGQTCYPHYLSCCRMIVVAWSWAWVSTLQFNWFYATMRFNNSYPSQLLKKVMLAEMHSPQLQEQILLVCSSSFCHEWSIPLGLIWRSKLEPIRAGSQIQITFSLAAVQCFSSKAKKLPCHHHWPALPVLVVHATPCVSRTCHSLSSQNTEMHVHVSPISHSMY